VGDYADTTTNGGTTAFSTETAPVGILVNAVNDAPVVNTSASLNLTAINEDDTNSDGSYVYQVAQGSITDPDGYFGDDSIEAMAITSVDNTNGTWQYKIGWNDPWTNIDDGSLADNHALLLDSYNKVRFVPNADYNGDATFSFRAWDRSEGTAGQYQDTSINGGTTAYSADTASASVTVNAVNDAPTSTDSTITVTEDGTHSFTAADFNFSDADGDAFHSVKITQLPTAGTLYKKARPDLEFSFSDSSDPANDSRNSIHGTLTGATHASDPEQGDVVNFSTSTDQIQLDQTFNLGNEWTISAKFKDLYLNNNAWNTLTRGSTTDHQIIFHETTGELGTYTSGFNGTGFFASDIGSGWHEITAVGKGGKTYFYLDDQFVGVADAQSTSDVSTIGNHDGTQPFAEFLDDFQIKNTALLPEFDLDSMESTPSIHFDFSDSTNPAYDPDHGFTGTLTGASWVNDAQQGAALQFDATTDRLLLDQPIALESEWTISARFKDLQLGNGAVGALTREEGNHDIHIEVSDSGELGTRDRTTNTFYSSGYNMSSLSSSDWHTLTAVGKDGKTLFYINNQHVGTSDYQSLGSISSIGNAVDSATPYVFAQFIDDFRVYNEALVPEIPPLSLGLTEVAINDVIAEEDIIDLVFVPDANANGTDYSNLQYTVSDGTLESSPHTLTFDVTAVNDAPQFVNVSIPDAPLPQESWDFADSSYTGANGAVFTPSSTPTFVAGPNSQHSNAIHFDGVDDKVSATFNASETAFSTSFWFRTTDATGGLFEVHSGTSGHDRSIYLENGQLKGYLWQGGPSEIISSTDTYNDGEWHHVTYTLGGEAGGQTLYVDGRQVASGEYSFSGFTSQTNIQLGHSNYVGGHLEGDIAGFNIYDEALSSDDVLKVMLDADTYAQSAQAFEDRVNTTTDSDQHQSAIAATADGGAISVWLDQSGSTYAIMGQKLTTSRDGLTASGNEFKINTNDPTSNHNMSAPDIIVLENGNYVVAWEYSVPGSNST
ncbi:LamG-like jellyroll fold domain-containing protein, partial [Endozoicomonas atrinae]|uniref:LamG-like jellyroll fold domain-containing protein n=1 Tax=Endozoicomonas atrinae TaxID=1333660 RepID=UPI001EE71EEC